MLADAGYLLTDASGLPCSPFIGESLLEVYGLKCAGECIVANFAVRIYGDSKISFILLSRRYLRTRRSLLDMVVAQERPLISFRHCRCSGTRRVWFYAYYADFELRSNSGAYSGFFIVLALLWAGRWIKLFRIASILLAELSRWLVYRSLCTGREVRKKIWEADTHTGFRRRVRISGS